MIRYLTLDEVLDLHRWALQAHGGGEGVLNIGMVESALFGSHASFAGWKPIRNSSRRPPLSAMP